MHVAHEVRENPDTAWIVAGDFNDVAWSHTTRLFKRLSGLLDPRVGRTMLPTFHADHPFLRYPIDHVFVSKGFSLDRLMRIRLPGSDHFSIKAEFSLMGAARIIPRPNRGEEKEAKEVVQSGHEHAEERDVEA